MSNPRDYVGSAIRFRTSGSQAGLVKVNNYTLEHNRIEQSNYKSVKELIVKDTTQRATTIHESQKTAKFTGETTSAVDALKSSLGFQRDQKSDKKQPNKYKTGTLLSHHRS